MTLERPTRRSLKCAFSPKIRIVWYYMSIAFPWVIIRIIVIMT